MEEKETPETAESEIIKMLDEKILTDYAEKIYKAADEVNKALFAIRFFDDENAEEKREKFAKVMDGRTFGNFVKIFKADHLYDVQIGNCRISSYHIQEQIAEIKKLLVENPEKCAQLSLPTLLLI